MTEKRFVVEKYSVRDMSIDEKYVNSSYYIGDKGIAQSLCDLLNELHEEKEMWKRECKRLKGWYYLENEKVELEDIIGLVKTDEQTNSVELKKELYK